MKAVNCCLAHQINAVIARSAATWQSPGFSGMYGKRTNALTNRPELLGDCHDQSSDWCRNDSANERLNNNLPLSSSRNCSPHPTALFAGFQVLFPPPESLFPGKYPGTPSEMEDAPGFFLHVCRSMCFETSAIRIADRYNSPPGMLPSVPPIPT